MTIEELVGVTEIDERIGVTVSSLDPLTLAIVAVMFVLPAATAVAKPESLTLATDGELEVQVTSELRSLLEPLLYDPVAVNYWAPFSGIDSWLAATVIEPRTG